MKKVLNICKATVTVVLMAICIALLLSACGSASDEMSSLDKKYHKLAEKAATELLESEVSDYTWTTVETGEMVYLYSAKNSDADQIQVHYLAKFDAEDTPEDEWMELIVTLSAKSNSVMEASTVYWDVDTYEAFFDENNIFMGFNWSSQGWYNINLSDDEFEAAKQKNSK